MGEMRHQRQRYQLSRSSSHRKALLMNLCKEVIDHERIQTTETKAKAVKPEVEKLITLAKRGDLHARRQALSALGGDGLPRAGVGGGPGRTPAAPFDRGPSGSSRSRRRAGSRPAGPGCPA